MLRFGTDGVRGVALTELTEQYVADLGRAAAEVLSLKHVVIGRDTRESGLVLQTALARGFAAGGATVELLGVSPTPAIAFAASDPQSSLFFGQKGIDKNVISSNEKKINK